MKELLQLFAENSTYKSLLTEIKAHHNIVANGLAGASLSLLIANVYANVLLRAEVLNRLSNSGQPLIVVSYPEALFEKVITRKQLEQNTLKISKGDQLTIELLNEVLFSYNFNRTDFVTEPGEFSVRGGIVDVFSFSNN